MRTRRNSSEAAFIFHAAAPAQSPAILLDIKSPATATPPNEPLLTLDEQGNLWIKGHLYDYAFQTEITLDSNRDYWTIRDATGRIVWALEVCNHATGMCTGDLYSIGSFQGWITNPSQSGDWLCFVNAAGNTVAALNASGNASTSGSVPARGSAPPYEIPAPPAPLPVNPPPNPINLSVIDPDLDGLIIPWPQSQGRVYWGDIPGNLYEDVTDASWRYAWRSSIKTLAEYSIFRGLRYQTNPGGNPVTYGESIETAQNPGEIGEWDARVVVNGGVVSLVYDYWDSNWNLSSLPAIPTPRPTEFIPIDIAMTNPQVLPVPPYYYGYNADMNTSAKSRLYLYSFEFEHPDPSLIPQKDGDSLVNVGCCLNPKDVITTWTNHVELTLWDQFPPNYSRTYTTTPTLSGGQIWISEMWDGKLYATGVPDGNPVYSASGDVLMIAKVVWNISNPAKLWEGYGDYTFCEPYIFPDIVVDSNNNGFANSQDDPVEMDNPGKLIYLNQDDDNQDDVPDREELQTVSGENDLALIYLDYEALETTGTLTLEYSDSNVIRFWLYGTKGTSVTLPLSWEVDGSGEDWYWLYMEGINPGSAEITLTAKDPDGKIMGRDRVKVGVVGIEFTTSTLTAFGYDNGKVDDNPTTAALSAFNPPQKYDWVNVSQTENNVTTPTFVTATITPASLADYVNFHSQDTNIFTVSPQQATGASQVLEIRGIDAGKSLLTSRICVLDEVYGASLSCLNVAVYSRVVLNDTPFHTIRQSGLVPPTALSVPQLQTDTNSYLKQGVTAVDLDDAGATTVTYDLILNMPPNYITTNGRLDIDNTTTGGLEWQAVTNALGSPTDLTVIYVHGSLRHQRPNGEWSDAAGMSWANYVVLTDADSRYYATLSHELLHNRRLTDTGPNGKNKRNIMYYQVCGEEEFIGYFVVEKVVTSTGVPFSPRQFENQWEVLHP